MGNELGAGNPQGARRVSYVAIAIVCKHLLLAFECLINVCFLVVFFSTLASIFLLSTKNVIAKAFIQGNE